MNQYSVTGPFPYRGHEPGATFEAKADDAIKRAVARGSIAPLKKSEAASPATSTPTPTASPSGKAASIKEEK